MGQKALRVLVVDDDLDTAQSTAMLLEMHGHEIETVYDGLKAVGAARRLRPDVILLDIGLPGLDGYQVATVLREEGLLANTLLVGLTGWSGEAHKREAVEAGFDIQLTKPVRGEALLEVLAKRSA